MGMVKSITTDTFPKQGGSKGKRCAVLFRYGRNEKELQGTIVRDDYEDPWVTIIQLEDGRFVLAGECQYAPRDS